MKVDTCMAYNILLIWLTLTLTLKTFVRLVLLVLRLAHFRAYFQDFFSRGSFLFIWPLFSVFLKRLRDEMMPCGNGISQLYIYIYICISFFPFRFFLICYFLKVRATLVSQIEIVLFMIHIYICSMWKQLVQCLWLVFTILSVSVVTEKREKFQ